MRPMIRYVLALAATPLLLSCSRSDRAQVAEHSEPQGPLTVRGFARYAHEVRAFTPCDSAAALWVVDSTQALWTPWRELAVDAGEPAELFAVVEGRVAAAPAEGFGMDYAGSLIVDRVLYVAREGYGCAAPWGRFAFRAFGNEPFWSLTIAADSITLIRPGESERTWHGGQRVPALGEFTITAGNPAASGVAVRVTAEPCRDTMTGSYFGHSATVRLGGDSIVGCALAGGGR